jgi:predicted MFS family arabinose efflux permease
LSGRVAPAVEPAPLGAERLGQVRWSLLFGNFVIGCGVMVPVGTLPDIARSLDVSVAVAGQLVAVAAAVMCFGAPLLAGWVGALDRRKLLAASLAWYAAGHALCALMPSFAALVPVRAATVLGAAVFTPQAAAAIGAMTRPAERAGAITFIFIGWSVASVVGMPMSAWLGDTFGWQSAFLAIAAIGAIGAAWVAMTLPAGVRPPTLTLASWRAASVTPC